MVGVVALVVALKPLVFTEEDKGLVDSRGPAPTYTGTDFIPESRAQNVADAMSAFMTYIQVSDEVAQDHFHGWEEKVWPLAAGDVQRWHKDYSPQAEAEGYYQVGERVVESVRLKENGYSENRRTGGGRVELGACIDSSGLQVVAPGSQDDGIPPGRYSVSVVMVHAPEKDDWGNLVPGKPGNWWISSYSVDGVQWEWQSSPDRASSCTDREGSR